MNKLIRAVIVALLLLAMTACSGNNETTDTTVTPEVEAPEVEETLEEVVVEPEPEPEPEVVVPTFGGELRLAMSPADTLDPLDNQVKNVAQILNLIYEPLFKLDHTLNPEPVLVEAYEFTLDGRALVLTLKEGIVFHDGTPLTANDVLYTINRIKDNDLSPFNSVVRVIKRVSVNDERTITFYYDEPYAFALNDLVFPIVSKAYYGSESYSVMAPLGTGPYQFVDYQEMQEMSLTANVEWHGGSSYVENIHVIVMNETTNMETLFDQHLIDLMNPSKFNWLKYSDKDDQSITSYPTNYYDFVGFNFENELLQNVDLRKAFSLAINREAIQYNQFINHATIATTPLIPGSWFNTTTDELEPYSLDSAKSQLNQQLYKDGDSDGIYDMVDVLDSSKFNKIEFVMLVNDSSTIRTSIAPLIEGYIETLGFEVNVELVDSATYYERVAIGDFDLLYGGWELSSKPDYISLFSSDGSQNYFGYSSEEMDLTLQSMVSTNNQEIVKQRVDDFEVLFIEDMPYISLYFLEGAIMSHDNVYGSLEPTAASSLNRMESLYLDLTEE